jgi:hypothetical protein
MGIQTRRNQMGLEGTWRITSMDLWAPEDVDLMGPAFIEFDRDRMGTFRFVAVTGSMDCRLVQTDGLSRVEFSWEGDDDGDEVSGRGWAEAAPDGSVHGHIYFHMGDDSGFRAERAETAIRPRGRS